jgi:hypothetical protein
VIDIIETRREGGRAQNIVVATQRVVVDADTGEETFIKEEPMDDG